MRPLSSVRIGIEEGVLKGNQTLPFQISVPNPQPTSWSAFAADIGAAISTATRKIALVIDLTVVHPSTVLDLRVARSAHEDRIGAALRRPVSLSRRVAAPLG
ncbi:MAG: hypothetical protein CL933_20900 [Deltaproteobacteria bacterium]|nr:hypothetical protein [Deltaproteobacteria bacterium]